MSLTIIARIEAQSEYIERVKAESLKMIEPTRSEQGCLQYDLHQDNANPAVFLFYERWESQELWRVHMESPHLKAFLAAIETKVAGVIINEMSPLS